MSSNIGIYNKNKNNNEVVQVSEISELARSCLECTVFIVLC